jgi:lysyl-tRNA synthetase, class I
MHWAYRIAEELIRQQPERKTFVCASGISPSGSVHIGNFREIVTTFFVVKALNQLGKNARFIFSWDDFDRFRKVPKNVDPSFEKYIGMPYSEIPCPFGCHSSYAEHFEKEFEQSLEEFGIVPEFIYQSREYRSKRYNSQIVLALKQRKQIYDILSKYKTGTAREEERERFYPLNVYCEACRKDTTHIDSFDEQTQTLNYSCSCGYQNMISLLEATNIKLNWKIDWPMRWKMEEVIFEPGGRDHSSATGSYNVSKEIASLIYNYKAPVYEPYEFISIKGTGEKMSSSSGKNIKPQELLKVYTPETILFMFAKYQPNAAFHIGLDEDVIRNYSEYERYREQDTDLLKEEVNAALALSGTATRKEPKFSQIASILPLVNFNVHLVKDVLRKMGEHYTVEELILVCRRVEYWLRTCNSQKVTQINEQKDYGYYQTLTDIEKEWIKGFVEVLRETGTLQENQLMRKIYDICQSEELKMKRSNQKRLFSIIYKLVLNSSSGPRIPLLIHSIGREKLMALLEF